MPRIEGYIEVTIRIFKEDGQWVAVCRELGTSSCADDLQGAQEAIVDMIGLHLNSLEELGMRRAFFKKHGVKFYRVRPKRPRRLSVRPDEFVTSVIEPIPALAGAM